MDNHENEQGIETVTLQIEGMECGCEATLIEKKIRALAGVRSHEINPITHLLRVSYDHGSTTIQDVVRSISETGMRASLQKSQSRSSTWWREKQQLALYGCGLLALIAFVSGKLGVSPLVANGLYVLSVLAGVYYPARKALVALVNLTPTIHLLMLIGSGGAMALGLWGEAAVLIFVYSLGDVLESYAVDKARGAIRSLTELMPREALVLTEIGEVVRPIEQITVGDVVVVRPGERIPVDGRVVRGSSYVDQAAVTGEPIPVLREAGGDVFAGTINQNGSLEVEVGKPASETMLSKIIYSVEEAQAKKGKLQRFSDSFGVYYTPAMFVLGVLVAIVPPLFMGTEWLPFIYRGLVVFVVSCSCGLALSVPVAIVAAMAKAASQGTLFKGGTYLEIIDRVKVIAFDKTGTLTIGRPEVTDVLTFGSMGEQEVLDLAGTIESRSGHPLAAAIVRKARESGVFSGQPMEDFHENAGLGVTATVRGRSCVVGSPRCHLEQGISLGVAEKAVARLENEGKTVVLVSADGRLTGLVAIADTVRPGAVEALQRLRRAGVRTVMLTGDNERSARAIAHRVGVDEYDAQLLPTDKVDVIRRLREKYGLVAMVGDGINDAPAMAVADVGIAMGAAGTDIAIEAGDVVLMSDDLAKIAFVRELSSRVVATIRQNIVVSLVNVAFMVVMALLGYLGLVTGLLLNEASALFVIANALRLLKWQSTGTAAPVVAETTAPVRVKSGTNEQVTPGASPFATSEVGCACGEPMLGVSMPVLVVDKAKGSGCCASVDAATKAPIPIFTMAAPQGLCCSGGEATSAASASAPIINEAKGPNGLDSVTFRIDGAGCSCEGQIVEKRVKALKGVKTFRLNPITNQMKITYDPSALSVQDIQTAVKKAGAKAVLVISR
ncbi:MAG: heavy metal translocating P-type ATPase [Deltaproteobacteria bacterium]|nr:heavy metal translocating P-type ATPase [Deltaproteobacteria bacterium]